MVLATFFKSAPADLLKSLVLVEGRVKQRGDRMVIISTPTIQGHTLGQHLK